MDGSSLLALADLLKPADEQKDTDEELDVQPSPYVTPGSIGPTSAASGNSSQPPEGKTVSSEIWQSGEVEEQSQYEYDDLRPQPEYELVFKQAVSAEDVFLGMSNKNPTTASCEHMLVKIKLPGADVKQVELDITETFLDCRTAKYRLGLNLPHKVDEKKSKARWISDLEILEVTLHLNREYDFINH